MGFVVKQKARVFRTSEFPILSETSTAWDWEYLCHIWATSMVEVWEQIWELEWLKVDKLCHTARFSSVAGWWHLTGVWCGSEGEFESPVNSCHDRGCWRQVPVPSCSPEAPILSTKVYNISPGTKRALPTWGAAVKLLALCCFCLWFFGEWEGKGGCKARWQWRGEHSERSPCWHGQSEPFSRAEYDKCCFIPSWMEQDSTA